MQRKEITTSARCAEPLSAQHTPSLLSLLERRREFVRFLERRVHSTAIAEDILHSAYLRAIEHASTLASVESSTAWFYRILRNALVDFYRHRAVEDHALATWASELDRDAMLRDFTPAILKDIVCQCIAHVLPTLNAAYGEILSQVDLGEGSLATFASAHAITLQNATVRIHRARKALKQRLIETCGFCSAHGCLNCNCLA